LTVRHAATGSAVAALLIAGSVIAPQAAFAATGDADTRPAVVAAAEQADSPTLQIEGTIPVAGPITITGSGFEPNTEYARNNAETNGTFNYSKYVEITATSDADGNITFSGSIDFTEILYSVQPIEVIDSEEPPGYIHEPVGPETTVDNTFSVNKIANQTEDE